MKPALSKEVLRGTLASAHWVLEKWLTQVDTGLPGIDLNVAEDQAELFYAEMCAEVRFVSRLCDAIVEQLEAIDGRG